MIPKKLRTGDLLRVVSPSRSMAIVAASLRQIADQNLANLGLQVSFSRNCEESDPFLSSSIASRVDDLHKAFADPLVKGILSTLGGYNCNQLLDYLDYDLIRANPKILCGYSDITALGAAIFARTGLVTYSGPHYSSFGMQQGLGYTLEYFQKCLMHSQPFEVLPSKEWSDDPWYRDQDKRLFVENAGYQIIQPGQGQGRLIGGNLCTLNLLQGTRFMPALDGCILFVEDDEESQAVHFDRDLQSLLHQFDLKGLQGLIIGRFQRASNLSPDTLAEIIHTKRELAGVPVIAQADFGHTTPHLTLPVGGRATLETHKGAVIWKILEH
jgi:muramoyltetrapeptide carboxypeptidase